MVFAPITARFIRVETRVFFSFVSRTNPKTHSGENEKTPVKMKLEGDTSSVRLEKIFIKRFLTSSGIIGEENLVPKLILNPTSGKDLAGSVSCLNVAVNPEKYSLDQVPENLKVLDRKTVGLLKSENARGVVEMVTSWWLKTEHHMVGLGFYHDFVKAAGRLALNCRLEELVALVCFTGMGKRRNFRETRTVCSLAESKLKSSLNSSNEVSTDGLVLLCANLHKMNHVFTDKSVLDFVMRTVVKMVDQACTDVPGRLFGVIACLKMLRHSKYSSAELCSKIADLVSSDVRELNATELYHLLALLANENYCREEALRVSERRLKQLVTKFLADNDFHQTRVHPSESLRMKDMQGITWACASLGHSFTQETFEVLKRFTMDYYGYETTNPRSRFAFPGVYPDTLYSFVMMGYHLPELASKVMTVKTVNHYLARNQGRMLTKLGVVETAMQIETDSKIDVVSRLVTRDDVPFRSVDKDVQMRPPLRDALVSIRSQVGQQGLVKCDSVYISPRISIAGLKLNFGNNRELRVEVLDSSVTTRPSSKPHGLMKLKLRLMREMGMETVVLTQDEIAENKHQLLAFVLKKSSSC